MNEMTPPTSPLRPNTPPGNMGTRLPSDEGFDAGSAFLRLVVGGLLVGADELRDRLREWDEASREAAEAQAGPPDGDAHVVRYTVLGMACETEARIRRGFSSLLLRTAQLADDANLAYTQLALSARATPLDPLRRRLDVFLFQTLVAVDRWRGRGWSEERQGRHMARHAAVSVTDELLDYLARNPELRRLIERQGTGMADEAVDEVRERTASADQWIERIAHSLLRRPASDKSVGPVQHAGTPQQEGEPQTSTVSAMIPAQAALADAVRSSAAATPDE